MKFMLMMNTPGRSQYQIRSWSQDSLRAHIQFMRDLNVTLKANGELVGAEGLADPDQATLVRAGPQGEVLTDGVFAETKEFLAGFWILDVDSPERAHRIAADVSLAPGPDGAPLYLQVEVRQVMSAPV